jgi:hypothetical protein
LPLQASIRIVRHSCSHVSESSSPIKNKKRTGQFRRCVHFAFLIFHFELLTSSHPPP